MQLFMLIIFAILSTTVRSDSNTDRINKLYKYITNFNKLYSDLKRELAPGVTLVYVVQEVDDKSRYMRGLVATSEPYDQIVPPGTINTVPQVLDSARTGKVNGYVNTAFNSTSYTLVVPLTESNNQTVIYISAFPTNTRFDTIITSRYLLGKLMIYIRGFYSLIGNHNKTPLTYFVKDNSTSQYIRVLTTLNDQQGHFATGTTLNNSAVVQKLNAGETFTGNVQLFGKTCDAVYKPYKMFYSTIVLFTATC